MNSMIWISQRCVPMAVGMGMVIVSACARSGGDLDDSPVGELGDDTKTSKRPALEPECEALMDCWLQCGQDRQCADACLTTEAETCTDALDITPAELPTGCQDLIECVEGCSGDRACLQACQEQHKDDCPSLTPPPSVEIPDECQEMIDCLEQCSDAACAQACVEQYQDQCPVITLPPSPEIPDECQEMIDCLEQCLDATCAQACVEQHQGQCPVIVPPAVPEIPAACEDLAECLEACDVGDTACANACFDAAANPLDGGEPCPVVGLPVDPPQLSPACEALLGCIEGCRSKQSCIQRCLDADGGQCGMVTTP